MIAVLQPESAVYADWRDDLSANVTLFVGTSLVLLAVIYGFFSQASTRRNCRRHVCSDARADRHRPHPRPLRTVRLGPVPRDACSGRPRFTSLLGREPKDDILSFADVADITHPDDIDLLGLAEHLLESGETLVDETFRMRHADGSWIWLRARGEIQSEPDAPNRT